VTTEHIKSFQSSLAVAWWRLQMADVSLPFGSRTLPGLIYQLLYSRSCNSQLTQSQSASPSWCEATAWGSRLSDSFGFVDVGRPLWREDESVVHSCCWSSPAQSFSGPSPAGLMIIFYCFWFETPPTLRATSPYLYPPGTGWPSYTPRH
jgi:hypothetical protein